ncbi:MAG: metalloregulator ArsR/SmtB family transcription factor [Thermoplasmata archaeon]|nr:metalloregulator ArsR/SmtB family transcription factor [Thermoplasmata archaeon]
MSDEVCDTVEVHEDAVSVARSRMPGQAQTDNLADFFRIFGDRTRVRILLALDSGEMCVCDISEVLGMSMSATSHQLRMLRDAHLVSHRKVGKCVYYSLCDDHVRIVLETALEHVGELD